MKLLNIWNTNGDASTLETEHTARGHEVFTLMCKGYDEQLDIGNFTRVSKEIFVPYALKKARESDIIHIHAKDRLVPTIKAIYPKKKVVLTYHGSEIRSNNGDNPSLDISTGKRNYWAEREKYWGKADAITVTTKDLLGGAPENVVYTPAPVDKSLWKRSEEYTKKTAYYSRYWGRQAEADIMAFQWAKKGGMSLHISTRKRTYSEYRKSLESYEYFLDIKQVPSGEVLRVLSRSGLEFLALGGKVLNNGKIYKKFPEEASAENVANQMEKIYGEILKRAEA